MSVEALRSSAAGIVVALGTALAGSLISLFAYGAEAGWTCLAILAPVGLLTVLVVERFLAVRSRVGGMRRQLAVGGAIVVGQLLLAAGLFAALMTHSAPDALFTAVLAVYAGLVGAWSARKITRGVLGDIDELRRSLQAVAAGRRDVRIATAGGDELALVARDIEALAGTLQREEHSRATLEDARRQLLAAISHDVRTPLTSLRLLSAALADDIVDGPTRLEYVSRIGVHVRAMSAMIDDLFELSRLEAGDISWTMERVPLEDLVLEQLPSECIEIGAVRQHQLLRRPAGFLDQVLALLDADSQGRLRQPHVAVGRAPHAGRAHRVVVDHRVRDVGDLLEVI